MDMHDGETINGREEDLSGNDISRPLNQVTFNWTQIIMTLNPIHHQLVLNTLLSFEIRPDADRKYPIDLGHHRVSKLPTAVAGIFSKESFKIKKKS